jgi:hypothetical protein
MHAGHAYVEAIRQHLRAPGARLVEPLAGLTAGEGSVGTGTGRTPRPQGATATRHAETAPGVWSRSGSTVSHGQYHMIYSRRRRKLDESV